MATTHHSAVRMLKASGDPVPVQRCCADDRDEKVGSRVRKTRWSTSAPASGLKAWNGALDSSQNLFVRITRQSSTWTRRPARGCQAV